MPCLSFALPIAVRKNRYIILPVDLEEAWKVRFVRHVFVAFFNALVAFSKPSSVQTKLMHSVRMIFISVCSNV